MTSNFHFLKDKPQYRAFSKACFEAEKALVVSPAVSAIQSRRALELAVKWVYSFDSAVKVPYQDNLSSLIHDPNFLGIIDEDLLPLMKYVVKLGNQAVHTNAPVTRDEAVLSLHHLFQFIAWIDYCYSDEFTAGEFDESLLPVGEEKPVRPKELQDLYEQLSAKDRKLEEIIKENEHLRKKVTEKRERNTEDYHFQVDELDEFETRLKYIDLDLKLAGWEFHKDIVREYPVVGMPNNEGKGFVDYVLFGDNGKPLAVVEAKRTSKDPKIGRQQAKLYADCIEKMSGTRPVIFYTNGFETYIWHDPYPPRKVSGFYNKEELSLLMERRQMKHPLTNIEINDNISNRYYQKEAILAVCDALSRNQRKALLVMATGSGKTRTAISIVDVLTRRNWVKNILFLADRKTLLNQAYRSFNNLLPSLTLCNLLDNKDNPEESRMVFSTYPTMMNAIDDANRKDGKKLFTVGHFDLIIIDESHRSIYKKYRSIFDYFDEILLGLTATPKDEIDKNTYEVFGMENGVPTFAYELDQAVKDGYLVDYRTIETKTKFLEEGIHYDDLSEEEKEKYEETFDDDDFREDIDSSALNEWLFNDHTIDMVLQDLMEKGIKVEGGDKLGKTIIFAKNHIHAERIVKRFDALFPEYKGDFARVIDYSVKYVQTLIDDFSERNKLPQIAVSVDMLDTGVDIPEVVNLVFFKKVRSKSKFWQMIGRGTRLCPDLLGIGQDKTHFLIFDYCGNFEFFRENPKGMDTQIGKSLTEKLFNAKVDIIRELQGIDYQTEEYINHRKELVKEVTRDVLALDSENFRVRQHLQFVEKFKNKENWVTLSVVDTNEVKEHISPIIVPIQEDEFAKRFDLLMYTIELAKLQTKNATKSIRSVIQTAEALSQLGTIPQVMEQKHIIEKVLTEEFWESADIFELDEVREALRDLIKFIERDKQKIYYTNFQDEVIEVKENGPMFHVNDLQSYRKKVEHYLIQHKDQMAIYKLNHNKPLTSQDVKILEDILWKELGTREDYEKDYGDTPITKLVRQIVGLDPQAANAAFSEFLSEERLNLNQIRFVKHIVDYVIKNGTLDKNVLRQEPFRSVGSIVELFKDNMDDARKIIGIIDEINRNAEEITGA
ncbi:Type I restriction-modification system, restriction subunit R [Caldibacillus thermoamylovorans]|uniref:Type I restriction-modification system, restriction subunit R n=1 Tax=Caldibacillus thermoamylovorans TaxID=35841 RepID=A0A0D0GCF3_9BACI|nr:DEAD/DEAH box helicase family protein [Caldibacillus thermoamylovorans]KIO59231.1 Type I restriction-modification system, restriction subunit R [Caldibacillus thermoamylovorans]KIO63425.1 Type I restriction-modification system, restriction subunit R [Caldibacillus thermoamylovorans]KIO69756.1 Type I restriction-modification system, restriction subunit R [Caldibacillus thermoamylovorans]KIO71946.1 Type I restriction-modification system, restriction subunit R [Caldibacillus thermoamylovorans]